MEVRDIAADPTWEQAYALSVPVLAYANKEASQEVRVNSREGLPVGSRLAMEGPRQQGK